MSDSGALTFHEFMMGARLPPATIQNAVLEFLRGRKDAVVFGAQAVNAYVKEPRMTQDIDLLSIRAEELAHELRKYLTNRFHIAVLLLTFPELRRDPNSVSQCLQTSGADPSVLAVWRELVAQEIQP